MTTIDLGLNVAVSIAKGEHRQGAGSAAPL